MKIHQLPNGARFEYEGEEYVKTGPLFASGKNGQRLIPRYAVLKPLGDSQSVPNTAKNLVPKADVLAAFETFCNACKAILPPDRYATLDVARENFVKHIR